MTDDARAFLLEISAALGPRIEGGAPAAVGPPDAWTSRPDPEDAQSFLTTWRALGGEGRMVPDVPAARAALMEILAQEGALTAVRWREDLLDRICGGEEESLPCRITALDHHEPRADRIARTAQAEAGIVRADLAIAFTGTLVHRSGGLRLKSVSLLPPVLIAFVERSRVVDILSAALAEMRRWLSEPGGSQGIQLISGPSRSSDIENELTIGVHGPGRVHVVIIDDVT